MKKSKRNNSSGQRSVQENTSVKKGKRRKRRISRLRITIFSFIVILAAALTVVFLMLRNPNIQPVSDNGSSHSQAVFGVKTILVTGSSHYAEDQIQEVSGIYVGQSLFSVNKKKAAENILESFPYVEKVTVDSPAFDKIKISIVEEQPIGIFQTDSGWIIIGKSGKGLEYLPDGSDRLNGYLRIKGSIPDDGGVGHYMLEDRSLTILNSLFSAFDNYGLQNIDEINLNDYTNIRLDWKGQITIALGNDTNLDHEINVAVTTLNRVLQSRGDSAQGKLDLSTYSDSDQSNDMAVFTPEDELTDKAEK